MSAPSSSAAPSAPPAHGAGAATAAAPVAAPPRVALFDIALDALTMEAALARIAVLIAARRPALVVTPNVDHVVRLQRDAEFAALVRQADLVLADGQPLVWVSRLAGRPLPERVAGSDLLPRLCQQAAQTGWRLFFLGGAPGAAEGAKVELERRYPGVQIVGTHCPPLGFECDPAAAEAAVAAVRAAQPDVVCVGLGSPKQERWIVTHQQAYGPAVSIGVGISFSFLCGRVRRAPRWMQRLGLEWLHRLLQEPGRLWRRYLVAGWAFLPLAVRELRRRQRRPVPMREQV